MPGKKPDNNNNNNNTLAEARGSRRRARASTVPGRGFFYLKKKRHKSFAFEDKFPFEVTSVSINYRVRAKVVGERPLLA